jgi:NAD(P)-dependent dehydrogenase (short-subunit alcohol dehydrogenase family)
MAKAGVLALTKSAAQEYAKDGSRVNALVAGGLTRICFAAQSNKLSAMIRLKLQKASRGMLPVFPWAVLEIRWRRPKRSFGYVAALLRM